MKRKISVLLILALALSIILTGCGRDHQWKEATCTEPKTCTLCEETEGEALGHNKGELTIGVEATIFNAGTKIRPCTNCGIALTTERYELVSYFEDGKFLFTAADFTKKYQELITSLDSTIYAKESSEEGGYVTDISFGTQNAGICFAKDDIALTYEEKDVKGIEEIVLVFSPQAALDESTAVAEAVILYFMALDPALTVEEAGQMCTNIFNGFTYNSEKVSSLEKNGITHTLMLDGSSNFAILTTLE